MLCHNGGMPSTLDNRVEHILYVAICRRRSLDDFSTVRITERCSRMRGRFCFFYIDDRDSDDDDSDTTSVGLRKQKI